MIKKRPSAYIGRPRLSKSEGNAFFGFPIPKSDAKAFDAMCKKLKIKRTERLRLLVRRDVDRWGKA